MSVQSVTISLSASHQDGRNVSYKEFIAPLQLKETDSIVEVLVDRGKWTTGLVIFLKTHLSDFVLESEPSESLAETMSRTLEYIATWLDSRPHGAIKNLIQEGLDLTLFINLWIDQDQMEFSFPPPLLLSCGAQGLKIEIITND